MNTLYSCSKNFIELLGLQRVRYDYCDLAYTCVNARDEGLIPDLGRLPGGVNDNPLQYSSGDNPMDRGAWSTIVHGTVKSQIQMKD